MSSPWVASSSNIYFNTGSVGIGSSAPGHALDVSGSVSVTGVLYLPNRPYIRCGAGTSASTGVISLYVQASGGGAYLASGNQMTANVAGLWMVGLNAMVQDGGLTGRYDINIQKNGVIIQATLNDPSSSNGWHYRSATYPIYLNAGDYISLQSASALYTNDVWTTFYMYLL